ncbi:MAG: hypothetical protein SFU87_04385, partial [Chitinophagaceae bacterium]|nr:hypothetical protein [Chitinophagaceae bacterium]
MYKQARHIAEWLSRKRVLLFVLVFSMVLLALSIYRFDKRNQWLETEFEVQIQNIELNSGIAKLNLYLKKAESA